MSAAPSSFVGIIALVFFLMLVAGVWIGLIAMARGRRGAAWWLMMLGMLGITIGPIAFGIGSWVSFTSMARSLGSAPSDPIPSSSRSGAAATTMMALSTIAIPVGLLLFSIGFAMHGMKVARARERSDELEQLTAAMDSELARIREGRPLT